MISLIQNTQRERCGQCTKQIYIGQSAIVCMKCDLIFHLHCASDAVTFRQSIYCSTCIEKYDIIRYNPYFNYHELDNDKFYDNEPIDYIDIIDDMSNVLENCKRYSANDINKFLNCDLTKQSTEPVGRFSSYFYNIDGNKTNFDELAANISCLKSNFSVIGLAETNVDPCNKDLYKLNEYSSCYQMTKDGKGKGSGVALYIHKSLNYRYRAV